MRSMFTAISGLKAHQTKMDVIGHNIANVNTVGFKSSRVTFSEFFSQSLSGATGASDTTGRGGTNPMQIGLGTSVSSIDVNMSTGAAQTTGNSTDLMINGDGFFVVGDSSGTYFTRAGAFGLDASGNLVNASGMNVMGWDVVEDTANPGEYRVVKDRVKPISISGDKTYMTPTTTKNVEFNGNLNAIENPSHITSMSIYDSLGNSYTIDVELAYQAGSSPAEWEVNIGDVAYPNGDTSNAVGVTIASGSITFNNTAIADDHITTFNSVGSTVSLTENGIVDIGTSTNVPAVITVDPAGNLPVDAIFGDSANNEITLDFSNLTGFNEKASASATSLDGYSAGNLTNMSIGQDGTIYGQYSNGKTRPISMIPIATFANAAGLEKVGNSLFIQSANSGEFDGIGVEVGVGGGSMMGGALEMSNVDLSTEFTEMITTQRGFQANSRTITTSDELLQELVNLKR